MFHLYNNNNNIIPICTTNNNNNNNLTFGTCGYGYGYILGPSPATPIYLAGSFGLVRPAWIP